MRTILVLTAFVAPLCFAQTPSELLGVWKADLQKSKFAGPAPTQFLEIFEEKTVVVDRRTQEKAQQVQELSGVWGEHGEERALLEFVPNGKPYLRAYEGVPARITASTLPNGITLAAEVAGRPMTMRRVYEISPSGQSLLIDSITNGGPRPQHSTIYLLKQPDSAAEPLRKPEETAGAHFKNVKTETLKQLPVSEFIDNMRYFAWALDTNCEFCHVHGHFDSDDKREKKTARQMIDMTASIDQDNFKSRPEVRCFTCHEFHQHPISHPLFADEAERLEAAKHQGQNGPMQGAGSGPQGAKPGAMPPGKPQQ